MEILLLINISYHISFGKIMLFLYNTIVRTNKLSEKSYGKI